jgi:hypothetical protein
VILTLRLVRGINNRSQSGCALGARVKVQVTKHEMGWDVPTVWFKYSTLFSTVKKEKKKERKKKRKKKK